MISPTRRPNYLALFAALIGFGMIYAAALAPNGRGGETIVVDLQVEQSSQLEVFWNNEPTPLSADVTGGSRQRVEFRPAASRLYWLRIDPTRKADENIVIYRIAVLSADGVEADIPLTAVAAWNFQNITTPRLIDGRLTFHSTNADPYLYGPTGFQRGTLLERISTFVAISPNLPLQLILFGATAIALISLPFRSTIILCFAVGMSLYALFASIAWFQSWISANMYDVGTAVSTAALRGRPMAPQQAATVLAAIVALLLASLACWRMRRGWIVDLPPTNTSTWTASRELLIATLSLLVLALLLMPDLQAVALGQLDSVYIYHWDSHNITTWNGMIVQGKRPYTDFWYPYSGAWAFELPLPQGAMIRFACCLLLYWALVMALWHLTDRRLLPWIILSVTVLLLARANVIGQPERYLLSVALALSYVASQPTLSNPSRNPLWFWIACGVTLWGEPLQFVYALPGIVLVFLHDEFWGRDFSLRRIGAHAATSFGVPFLLLVAFLSFLAYRGEFHGFIENSLLSASHVVYAPLPANLLDELPTLLSRNSIGVIGPYIVLAVGVVGLFKPAKTVERRIGLAMLCCGFIGVMLLQKQLLRPIGAQLLSPTIVGALLTVPLFWTSLRGKVLASVIAGALVATISLNASVVSVASDAVRGAFARTASSYNGLYRDSALFENAQRSRLERSHFRNYPQELAVVDRLRELGRRTWFSMTDMPIFYLFSDGPTPFQVNEYNTAPVRAQADIRTWLRQTKPDAVILDPSEVLRWDGIHLSIRVPLVANEIILNYVPLERVGPYHILTRRAEGQPIDLGYWREVFGSKLDYGRILGYTRAGAMPACPSNAASACLRYLELTFEQPVATPVTYDLPVFVGSTEFHVSFTREPGVRTQYIPIDRIWFWVAGDAMGINPEVHTPPGVSARIVGKMPESLVLY